jgi:cation diffusion facilitator family transporter
LSNIESSASVIGTKHMASCCEDKNCEISQIRNKHARVLWVVLAINFAMFFVESIGGIFAASTSLLADSLDMLGDTLVYAFSLFVLNKSERWQATAAGFKGAFMLVFGIAVLGQAVYKALNPVMPDARLMSVIGALALTTNAICFMLLWRHRGDNLNMSSTYRCSRNDLIANASVLAAALGCFMLASRWPDVIVGVAIAVLFLQTAVGVVRDARRALNKKANNIDVHNAVAANRPRSV